MKPHICSFESRKSTEMRSLIERCGGVATIAPSMKEVPLSDNRHLPDFVEKLRQQEIDVVIFMTGVGARSLAEAISDQVDLPELVELLAATTVMVRGPKPTVVLRGWKARIDHRVPEPNTWRELVETIDNVWSDDSPTNLEGVKFAVQEYGIPSTELYNALKTRGADVYPVTVYRWALPDDCEPLLQAIKSTIAGDFDCLMITSAQQVHHVLEVADSHGLKDDWITAANNTRIASIGPTASETIRSLGLHVDLEPSHPKMGHLVRETLEAISG
ncbi:MAG: uroporphyrinogen III synthase [Planctomycetaceae bacterium]|nr:uroporphyrinogen III synthase [Planctomycetaceae bacterium]